MANEEKKVKKPGGESGKGKGKGQSAASFAVNSERPKVGPSMTPRLQTFYKDKVA